MPVNSLTLIATTAFGLEAVAKRELADLGYDGKILSPGRVQFRGDLAAICRANLWLRTADRVLIEVARFQADNFDALFDETQAAAWDRWIGPDASFPVIGRSLKSQLTSVPACQRAVKKAVVESLLTSHHTDALPESGPLYKIEIALLNNEATLTIDTTGPSLHKRGYRQVATVAPLKETLAAAMVLLSFWDRDRPLLDPFCGSGTLPIEAAMIGRRLAPGRDRSFASESWPNIPVSAWNDARSEARDAARSTLPERLLGTDLDDRALHAARCNAERAGVAEQVHFQQRPFGQLSSKRQFGCLITNPPYGRRIGERDELERLYQSFPETLRELPTWSHFILTAYPRFENVIQKPADRRRKLYNGRIECTFFQFHGPHPNSSRKASARAALGDELPDPACQAGPACQVASADHADPVSQAAPADQDLQSELPPHQPPTPVFGGITDKGHEQADLFRSRLENRARHLRRWPTKRGITCFRLYDRDVPEIPLVVDRYEDHLHITEYERPHDRDLAQHADWLDLMVRTAGTTLSVDRGKIFLKRRQRQRGPVQHPHLGERKYEIEVGEGNLRFLVNLSDYVDTGLFLDHRNTRQKARELASGANFLNLFAYTGAFTVYAAAGGAARTTTLDWSRTYLDWARRNMALNGYVGPQHQFVREDARRFIDSLPADELFDLAVVDPPTFSNSKLVDHDWNIQHDYGELVGGVLSHMKAGGVIFFSTNFRGFKWDDTVIPASQIHEITKQTLPEDFRNRRIHRCWRIVK